MPRRLCIAEVKVTAADVRAALLTYYSPPEHRIFFEVANDTGTRARRWVDAVALGIWPSTGYEIVGIEIKVSRSDWLGELKRPAKAQELMRFCTRWYLAAPPGVLRPNELPRTWGHLEYRAGQMRRVVPAPLLEAEQLTPGFVMAVLRQANSVDAQLVGKLVDERVAELRRRIDQEVERGIAARSEDVARRNRQALEIAAKLEEITGEPLHAWNFDTPTLAAAYLLLRETSLHRDSRWDRAGLLGAARHLRELAEKLDAVCQDPRFAAVRARLEPRKKTRRR